MRPFSVCSELIPGQLYTVFWSRFLCSVLSVVTACNKSAVAAEKICTNITSAINFDQRRIIFRHPGVDNVWPVYFTRVVERQGQLFCLWEKTECSLTDFNSEEYEN